MGIGNYMGSDFEELDNPPNDAKAIAAALDAAGAEVMLVINPSKVELMEAVDKFCSIMRTQFTEKERGGLARRATPVPKAGVDDKVVGIFFYAGHGLEVRAAERPRCRACTFFIILFILERKRGGGTHTTSSP